MAYDVYAIENLSLWCMQLTSYPTISNPAFGSSEFLASPAARVAIDLWDQWVESLAWIAFQIAGLFAYDMLKLLQYSKDMMKRSVAWSTT